MHTTPKNPLTAALAKRRPTTPQLSDYPQLALAATSNGPELPNPETPAFTHLMATLDKLGRLNLGARNAHALGLLSKNGPMRPSELCTGLHLSTAGVSLILRKLEALGLVVTARVGLHGDRRQVTARLTQAGSNVLACLLAA